MLPKSFPINNTHSLGCVVGGLLDDLAVDFISQRLLFLPQLNKQRPLSLNPSNSEMSHYSNAV